MCEYFAIRAPEGRALPLAELGERLSALGLRHDRAATWLTGDDTGAMVVNAEVDASGRFAAAPDDLVVSLDVTLWCPHSGRTAQWPDEATTRAGRRLLGTVARAVGWTLLDRDDPAR
ncbi:hypothetical protein [Saccharothrix texasensis]|uniref:Uncharacterized protein n=1 Tax=Saccharothrix texasensis TaxID=103734 RepID=A0A3N1H593_9PSEU|nr:hypothetical protein [Saccharothrix texasensis]ROP37689.1 hypothetical protein EDD40_3010 [Saccharothrix texasensis]